MIVVCNKCDTKYKIEKHSINENGSDLRCTKCGHVWFQKYRNDEIITEAFTKILMHNKNDFNNRAFSYRSILFIFLTMLILLAIYLEFFTSY